MLVRAPGHTADGGHSPLWKLSAVAQAKPTGLADAKRIQRGERTVPVLRCLFVCVCTPHSLQDLSSQIRDQTRPLAVKATSPTHWAAKEFLQAAFILSLVSKLSALLRMVLEKTLESPLNCKEIKPLNPKANEP